MANMDQYFPFTSGAGSTATQASWQAMASYFMANGVISGAGSNFSATISGTTVTLNAGAVWINGIFGENTAPKSVTVTSNGLIYARLNYGSSDIEYDYEDASYSLTQNTTYWDIPLWAVVSGALQDWRYFTGPGTHAPGEITEWAGSTPPNGSLFCDGATVLQSQYPRLYAIIGSTYNVGTVAGGSFMLPDHRGRVTLSPDNMGGTPANRTTDAAALGSHGGTSSITLSSSQVPDHAHSVTDPGHNHTLNESGGHVHNLGTHYHAPTNASFTVQNASSLVNMTPTVVTSSYSTLDYPLGTAPDHLEIDTSTGSLAGGGSPIGAQFGSTHAQLTAQPPWAPVLFTTVNNGTNTSWTANTNTPQVSSATTGVTANSNTTGISVPHVSGTDGAAIDSTPSFVSTNKVIWF